MSVRNIRLAPGETRNGVAVRFRSGVVSIVEANCGPVPAIMVEVWTDKERYWLRPEGGCSYRQTFSFMPVSWSG